MRNEKMGWVYIIGADESGMVKIGYTANPPKRFVALRTACPVEMTVLYLMPGDPSDEKELHRRFADLRLRKEWFRFEQGSPLDVFVREALTDLDMYLHCEEFNEGGYWFGRSTESKEDAA